MTAEIALPATIAATGVADWSDEVDVLVVGAGMAGTSAAIEAARNGARVLVLDRGGPMGCTTAMAGGHFYLGGGTPVQHAAGFEDNVEDMAAFLTAMSPDCDPAKIEAYCADSVEHFGWLEALGFEFERSFWPGKAAVQPGTEGLMFTGNEQVWPWRDQMRPTPRGHKPPVQGDFGGAAFVLELAVAELARLGVEIRHETGVTELVTEDGSGAVVGARWKHFGATGAIRAGAVIIAAGGFVMNDAMVAEYVPLLQVALEKGMALGNPHDDGLGIRLGQSAGGAVEHLDGMFLTAPFYPPGELVKGICVNAEGERFVAEDSYHGRTTAMALDQPGHRAYLILDSAHMAEPAYGLHPLIDGWETVAEMEAGLGVPAGSLERTLTAYNASAAHGRDPAFGKAADYVEPLDTPPYGAYDLTPGAVFIAGFTCGGLRVDVDARVLAEDETPVSGLYAAGACASNIVVDGYGYASGLQLGEASFFGRRAGRHAAVNLPAGSVTQITPDRSTHDTGRTREAAAWE